MTYANCVYSIMDAINDECDLSDSQYDRLEKVIDAMLCDYMQSSQRHFKQELHSALDKTFREAYNV